MGTNPLTRENVYLWLACGQSLGPFTAGAPETLPGFEFECPFCLRNQTAWAESDRPQRGEESRKHVYAKMAKTETSQP